MTLDGRKILLIDTPGFDDTEKSDVDILQLLADHLQSTYAAGKLLTGIILLQQINHNRITGQERRRTRLFEEICGENAFENVVIATTMWGEVNKSVGISREQERIKSDSFWGTMVKQGTKVVRHDDNRESACKIVRMFLNKQQVALQLQEQLEDNNGQLSKTSAGQEMNKELGEKYAKIIKDMSNKNNLMEDEMQELRDQLRKVQEEQYSLSGSIVGFLTASACHRHILTQSLGQNLESSYQRYQEGFR